MAVVRSEQMQAFRPGAESAYVESAVAHFEKHDPVAASAAGRKNLEEAARQGLEAARKHGLSQGSALQLYLELMAKLGSGFDTDPQFAWLHPFLEPREDLGTVERSRLVHFHAEAYLSRALGANGEHARAALGRALAALPRLVSSETPVELGALELIGWLHPERADFASASAAAELQDRARMDAAQAGLPMPQAASLLLMLEVLYGHEAARDPLQPWIGEAMASPGTPDQKFRALALAARKRLESDMAHLEGGERR